jgi:hypothetical protein
MDDFPVNTTSTKLAKAMGPPKGSRNAMRRGRHGGRCAHGQGQEFEKDRRGDRSSVPFTLQPAAAARS